MNSAITKLFALYHPAARGVGIDLSPTSLEHSERLKRKNNLTNLETRQLSLENAGTAGVLLNQTHLFKDLYLLIDESEKRIFETIDGRRSIGEIVDKVKIASPLVRDKAVLLFREKQVSSLARDFFEKLWRYDQVVFDT